MKMDILKANIKKRRRELNLSQSELAKKMGVSYQTINTWENNPPASFSQANLDKLSTVLECKKEWLLEGKSKSPLEALKDEEQDYHKGAQKAKTIDGPSSEVVGSGASKKLSPEEEEMRDKYVVLLEKTVARLEGKITELEADLKAALKKKDGTHHPK